MSALHLTKIKWTDKELFHVKKNCFNIYMKKHFCLHVQQMKHTHTHTHKLVIRDFVLKFSSSFTWKLKVEFHAY